MTTENPKPRAISYLDPELTNQIMEFSETKEIPKNAEILRAGQFVKVIPIVLDGLIKVFTRYDDKELLLYYIRPKESCIMSFAASQKNEKSTVFAIAEEDTTALLLPTNRVSKWVLEFPDINTLFFQQYNLRYSELITTIHHVLFDKMDKRLLNYIEEKIKVTDKTPLKISHRQIANDLGTAREVVSRVIKKLENEGAIKQHSDGIELVNL